MSGNPGPQGSPLRLRLLLLAASGLVPIILLLAWGINQLIDDRRQQVELASIELSRALATAVDAELSSTVALLQQLGTSDELERADMRAFHLSARRTAEELGWRDVILSDSEGRVLFRSNRPYDSTGNTPTAEQQSLEQAARTLQPVISSFNTSQSDGSDTFAVRVPVSHSGELTYVLTAVLPTSQIAAVLTRQSIPASTIASVVDPTGRLISRSPPADLPDVGSSIKALLASGGSQGAGIARTAEGVQSIVGFTRLDETNWVVTVSSSLIATNKAFDHFLRAIAVGLGASLGLSALLAWVLSRHIMGPIDQLKRAASTLGRGGPVQLPHLQIEELDEVAEALTQAAVERDNANRERNRSIAERERAAAERERLAGQITEALRMAEDANRAKDQFMAMLGHELRNPLAPISNAVQLMALKGDERTAPERRIIERQLVHVTRLVDDLIDVSRITSGRLALRRERVSIAHVLTQVIETIQSSLQQRTLKLDFAPDAAHAFVAGDEVRLVQVFNNLLVNAIKFTSTTGVIFVKANVAEGGVRVAVADDGIGMPQTDLDHVFDLFYQAPQSVDRSLGGLGLGLPIVKSLVEMHGGHVHAASEGANLGSCLTVWLPMCEAPAPHDEVVAPPPARGAGRILVVDDNEDAADTCATLLEMSGYQTRVAYTPEGALEVMRDFTPDVAVLDIGLPGMSGYELARVLKGSGYGGALVALTGYGQAADMAASKAAGFDAHLTKPVSSDELLELIGRFSPAGSPTSVRA